MTTRTFNTLLAAAFAAGLSAPALASPEHLQTINDQCGIQLNGSPSFCACLQETAGETLNENQQAFVAARVTNNVDEIGRLTPLLSVDEATAVATFMTTFGGCSP